MSESNEVLSEPKLERRTRRRFTAAEKQRLLGEAEALGRGEQSAWLRRNGLYASQLSEWRKTLAETGVLGLEPKSAGRKPADPRDRELERLRKENARLQQRAEVAEDLVELQKNWPGCSNRPAASRCHEAAGGATIAGSTQPRL